MTALRFRTGEGEVRPVSASRQGQSYLQRLRDLHLRAVMHEMSADPCTPERAHRARRADQIARALRDEQVRRHVWGGLL